jgi:hypothetical protein
MTIRILAWAGTRPVYWRKLSSDVYLFEGNGQGTAKVAGYSRVLFADDDGAEDVPNSGRMTCAVENTARNSAQQRNPVAATVIFRLAASPNLEFWFYVYHHRSAIGVAMTRFSELSTKDTHSISVSTASNAERSPVRW